MRTGSRTTTSATAIWGTEMTYEFFNLLAFVLLATLTILVLA